ncbi:MAG TPA: NAD(P)H-dependent oxidoreductase, partial [Oculatellaceae cyanobacterium]
MSILVLSASLRPQSRSRVLARKVFECLQAEKATVETVDLRDFPLPFCDGDAAYEHENIARIQNTIHRASVILIGLP